jgi:AGZA family xanthine/uracil permease-like MFS transporter
MANETTTVDPVSTPTMVPADMPGTVPGSNGHEPDDLNAIQRELAGGGGGPGDYFGLKRWKVTLRGEIMAGLSTFLVMSYIAFVNPSILTQVTDRAGTQLNFGEVLSATCWVAAALCIIMGVYARRPFAMASGMGLNAFVAFSLVAAGGLLWGQAFGLVVLEGIIITLLVLTKFREAVMEAVPATLTKAIAAGIGLFLLFIGLNEGGIVAGNPTYALDPTVPPVQLGNFFSWTILITLVGLFVSLVLYKTGNRGALLIGIIVATIVAIILNGLYNIYDPKLGWAIIPNSVVSAPATPRFFGIDLGSFGDSPLSAALNTFSLMLSDFFDTLGTFMGLALLAGFLTPRGKLSDPGKPLLVDSIGPILGGAFGASSATTYIESGAGISAGGRTGITAITVGVCFALVPFFTPLVAIVPQQATAAALIVVGIVMFSSLRDLEWDFGTLAPVVLTVVLMPLTYSITNGIGAGFITYCLLALFSEKRNKIHPLMWVCAIAFVIYFAQGTIRAILGVG